MKRPIAKAISWIANVRFYSRMKFKKSEFPEFKSEPTMLTIKKCLVWNPNLLHKGSLTYVDKK